MASDPSRTTACASSLSAANPNHQPIHPRLSPIFFLDPIIRLERNTLVRARGIEPRFQAWEAHVIAVILHPLNHLNETTNPARDLGRVKQ